MWMLNKRFTVGKGCLSLPLLLTLLIWTNSFADIIQPTHILANNVFKFLKYTIGDSSAVLMVPGSDWYETLNSLNTLPNLEVEYYDRANPSMDSAYIEHAKQSGKIVLGYGMCNFPGWNSDSSYVFGYLERFSSSPPSDSLYVRAARGLLYTNQDYSFITDPQTPWYMIENFSSTILNTMSPLLDTHRELADSLISFFIDNGYYKYMPLFCLLLVMTEIKEKTGILSESDQQKLLDGVKEWIETHSTAHNIEFIKQLYEQTIEEFSNSGEKPSEPSHSTTHGSESE